jgi:hypothetical protein
MPEHLDQRTFAATKDIEVAGMGIALEDFLDLQRQIIHAAPHVSVAGRDPDPHARRNREHRSACNVALITAAVASAPIVTGAPQASSITITDAGAAGGDASGGTAISGPTNAGTKPGSSPAPAPANVRRHSISTEREIP